MILYFLNLTLYRLNLTFYRLNLVLYRLNLMLYRLNLTLSRLNGRNGTLPVEEIGSCELGEVRLCSGKPDIKLFSVYTKPPD